MTSSQAWLARAARGTGSNANSGNTFIEYLQNHEPEPGQASWLSRCAYYRKGGPGPVGSSLVTYKCPTREES